MTRHLLLAALVSCGTVGCFSSAEEGDGGVTTATASSTSTSTASSSTSASSATATHGAGTSGFSSLTASTTSASDSNSTFGINDAATASASTGRGGTSGTGSATIGSTTASSSAASNTNSTFGVNDAATASAATGRSGTLGSGTSGFGVSGTSGSSGTTGGLMLGSSCQIPQQGETDPCAALGLACVGLSPLSGSGTCQLPPQGYACEPTVGCAAGDLCEAFPDSPASCYQTCSGTTDCSMSYEICEDVGTSTSLCIPETCGPGSPTGGQYYAPCNVVGEGDGYCVPFTSGSQTFGLCFAGAPADAGLPESCVPYGRGDGGGLCPVGLFCYVDYETTGTQCQPFCGVVPVNGVAGPGCADGQFCVQSFGSLFGSCAPTCPVPDQPQSCPTGENCLVTGQAYGDGGQAFTCEP